MRALGPVGPVEIEQNDNVARLSKTRPTMVTRCVSKGSAAIPRLRFRVTIKSLHRHFALLSGASSKRSLTQSGWRRIPLL